jgi:hypothetical protein
MRRILFVAASAFAVLTAAGSNPAAAQDTYCLQGGDWGWPGLCQFRTYGQCLASASGTRSYCGINPSYAFAGQRRGDWQGCRGCWQGY